MSTSQCPPLPDDLICSVCAHVRLRERLSVCAVVSHAFEREVRRLGGRLTLRRGPLGWHPLVDDEESDDRAWEFDGCQISQESGTFRVGGAFCPTFLCLSGFDTSDGELGSVLQRLAPSVTTLEIHECRGQALEWHETLAPVLPTVTVIHWDNPRIPVHVAVSLLSAFRCATAITLDVCLMPQPMQYTQEQLRSAFLCLGGLAAIPTLQELTLSEDTSPEDTSVCFGCPASWTWKNELACDPDVVSGLALGLSALTGLRTLECDMLADWSYGVAPYADWMYGAVDRDASTAKSLSLMLSRMQALEELNYITLLRADSWRPMLVALGPTGHPRLRELTLTYSEARDGDLESMARSVQTAFPQLSWLRLEVNNHALDSPSALVQLARSLAGLRDHSNLRRLELELDLSYDPPSDEERLKLELAPFKGLATEVKVHGVVIASGVQGFLHVA